MEKPDWRAAGVKKGVMNDRFRGGDFAGCGLALFPLGTNFCCCPRGSGRKAAGPSRETWRPDVTSSPLYAVQHTWILLLTSVANSHLLQSNQLYCVPLHI